MSSIDIRDESITHQVSFADENAAEGSYDVAYVVIKDTTYENYVFLHASEDFIAIRNKDVDNLIKALQYARDMWSGLACKSST